MTSLTKTLRKNSKALKNGQDLIIGSQIVRADITIATSVAIAIVKKTHLSKYRDMYTITKNDKITINVYIRVV